ncbi:MAG: molybdate ABC transporter permease subunit [Thermoguttaceae bacterium]
MSASPRICGQPASSIWRWGNLNRCLLASTPSKLSRSSAFGANSKLRSLAVALGYVLARFHFLGKWLIEVLIDLPLVLPPVVTGYLLLVGFAPHGAVGSILREWLGIRIVFTWLGAALASAVVGFPLMVRAIRLAFQGVDPRFEMAARSLGAGRLGAFFTVTLTFWKSDRYCSDRPATCPEANNSV